MGGTRALSAIRAAALAARNPWPETKWRSDDGSTASLAGGTFGALALEPGISAGYRHELTVPYDVAGVPLAGEPLEVTVDSVFPTRLSVDGRALVDDDVPTVALGPALVTAVPALAPGTTTRLQLDVRTPAQQTAWPWVRLTLTTPALRARADALDLVHARLLLARAVADSPHDRMVLDEALAHVPEDPGALGVRESEELERQVSEALAPFDRRIAELHVHLVGHSHIDMNWLWTWDDTVAVVRRDLRAVADLLDDYSEATFVHSQVATYEIVREHDPDLFRRIHRLVAAGRWEPATMQWVEADSVLPSSESHARHLLEAVRWTRDALGVTPTTLLAPDTFGHTGGLPQLAVSAGARRYYHHRANPGTSDPWPAYWWEGDDGSRILALSTPSYHGPITASVIADAAARALRHGQRSSLVMYGVGDHGGGPARQDLDRARVLTATTGMPELRHSTLAGYGDDVLASTTVLPVHRGESATVFEGCYTSHAEVKQANRDSERLLTTADTLAATSGTADAGELAGAWRSVLFNQFHDIICGASVHEVYPDALRDHAGAQAGARQVLDKALAVHAGHLPAGTLAVTNPHPWRRTDAVVVPVDGLALPAGARSVVLSGDDGSRVPAQVDGHELSFVATIAASSTVGYRIDGAGEVGDAIDVASAHAPQPLRPDIAAGTAGDPKFLRVRTPLLEAYIRRDNGVITGLRLGGGDDYVAFGMCRHATYLDSARADLALGVLQVLDELPHGMSAWHLDEVAREESLLTGADVRIVHQGPVRAVIEVTHRVRSSTIQLRLTFWAALARVDTDADIDWQEPGSPDVGVPSLKVAFTARLPQAQAWYETPASACTRPADGQEVPASRWADVSGGDRGFAVLNRGRHGYDALGSRLRLSLVRSGYEPDEIAGPGRYRTSWSLLPHLGCWRTAGVPRAAVGYDTPLLAHVAPGPSDRDNAAVPWRPVLEGDASVLATAKPSYDGAGTLLRLTEAHGRPADVVLRGLPAQARVRRVAVTEIAAEGRPVTPAEDGTVALSLHPFEIVHLLMHVVH